MSESFVYVLPTRNGYKEKISISLAIGRGLFSHFNVSYGSEGKSETFQILFMLGGLRFENICHIDILKGFSSHVLFSANKKQLIYTN